MKFKKIIMICTFCILLTGCSKDTKSDKPTTTNQENSAQDANTTLTPTAKPTIAPTQTIPTTTPVPEVSNVTPLPHVYLDYSGHTDPNESSYITKLADLSALKDGKPIFSVTEPPADWSDYEFAGFDQGDPTWGYDVRSCDLSKEDLSVVDDSSKLSFNTDTIWPKILPDGFDPNQILEYNKNPGLGIQELHKEGITGKGVGIAIIDLTLLLDHEQYKDNLMFYEKIHCDEPTASLHGPSVASIAVGKDIGVAPDANLYFIASTFGHYTDSGYEFDAAIMADTILRVLEMNKNLPDSEKIRVISISKGYMPSDIGYTELMEAIKKADEENIFVITCSTEEYYKNFKLFGADRDYQKDPDDIHSYEPASWLKDNIYQSQYFLKDCILCPMGSRTLADPNGSDDYFIMRNGGLSWTAPWCAGFYAMCCQVKPDITPQEFIDIVNATSTTVETNYDDKSYEFGKMINPAEVIKVLQKDTK